MPRHPVHLSFVFRSRAKSEKEGRVVSSIPTMKDIAEARRREEEEWAAKSGPVTVRKIEKEN